MTTNRQSGGKIGIVAGNFDVIHPGYVKMFEKIHKLSCIVPMYLSKIIVSFYPFLL